MRYAEVFNKPKVSEMSCNISHRTSVTSDSSYTLDVNRALDNNCEISMDYLLCIMENATVKILSTV